MAKSRKKTKKILQNNQNQSNTDQLSEQNQPSTYTKVKSSSSRFSIFYYLLAITFCLLMFNSAINHLMGSYALSSALSQGYAYASYIDKNMTLLDMFFSGVFYCIVLSYVLVIWALADSCGHNSSGGGSWGKNSIMDRIIGWWFMFPFLSILPIIFFCNIYHRNVDELMYENIKELYQHVSQDPKFEKTSMNAKFQKAIEEKDYETLKELSSNINSLAKLTPEQLNTIETEVSKVPLSKIRKDFEIFKDGYSSYAEYLDFYDKSQKLFKASEYSNSPRYVNQMKNLKITHYDYTPIKTIIKQ
jgi:hypothetical protein